MPCPAPHCLGGPTDASFFPTRSGISVGDLQISARRNMGGFRHKFSSSRPILGMFRPYLGRLRPYLGLGACRRQSRRSGTTIPRPCPRAPTWLWDLSSVETRSCVWGWHWPRTVSRTPWGPTAPKNRPQLTADCSVCPLGERVDWVPAIVVARFLSGAHQPAPRRCRVGRGSLAAEEARLAQGVPGEMVAYHRRRHARALHACALGVAGCAWGTLCSASHRWCSHVLRIPGYLRFCPDGGLGGG